MMINQKSNPFKTIKCFPMTSLILFFAAAPSISLPSIPVAVRYTSCQSLHMTAVSAADGQIGGFIPECTPGGAFKPVQCHALTGFCWCVNHIGVRIVGTEERYKEPSCEGMSFVPLFSPSNITPSPILQNQQPHPRNKISYR